VRTLRAGIIGPGFVGRIHARSVRVAGAQLAGVVASTPRRSAEARRELGAELDFPGAEELIASDEVDVVHICTPNHLHFPLASAALEAGKHIVCEKPIALDSEDPRKLVAVAATRGLVATVPFVYRYYPTVREARARLISNRSGEIRAIYGGYLQDWLLETEDHNWRVESEFGGRSRAFADIGSHWCDLVEFVSGKRIVGLFARTAVAHPERRRGAQRSFERGGSGEPRPVDTEDIATVLFEAEGGALGSVVVSQVSAGHKNKLWFEIATPHETLAFDQEHPEQLSVLRRTTSEAIPRDPAALSPEAAKYATLPGGHPQGYHDCFDAFIAETYASIAEGSAAPGLPQLEDGLRAGRITRAVLDSARLGEWVQVKESGSP
jgi:predicted dehydrogenase